MRGTNEADKRLFSQLLEALPSDGVIKFVKDQDMGDIFIHKQVFPLYDFPHKWDNAEHEFRDAVLEKQRLNLLRLVERFSYQVSMNTFRHGDVHQGMETEWPEERFEKVRKMLNDLGDEVVAAHQDLVRTAKKRLNV